VKSHVLAARVAAAGDPSIVAAIKAELECEDKKVRNVAVKTLSHLAGYRPEWLMGELDFFLGLLENEENTWKWAAMDVVGHLAELDGGKKIGEVVIEMFIASLKDSSMVTATHGVDNVVRVALTRTDFHSQALAELFQVESIPRRADCREVLLGKVADGLGRLLSLLSDVNHAAALTFLSHLSMRDGRAGSKAAKIISKQDRS
jgi:hypothetical protein